MDNKLLFMKKYDIFISYRRSSYDTANLIATRLKSEGYSVFFDMEALRSGKFNEQLYEVIDNCRDFLVVLPPGALERCVNQDDWVRLEVCRALAGKKNVIPVMLNGFEWPAAMPKGMEELCEFQALTSSSVEYFDLAMERLQKRYLQSRKQLPINKFLKYAGVCIPVILVLLVVLWGVFATLSKDACLKYATSITMDAGNVHLLAEENHKLAKDWATFNNAIEYETRTEKISVLQENMEQRISLVEKNLDKMWMADSTQLEIGPYHSFLLSIHGINAEEISISPLYATIHYWDYKDQLNAIRNAVWNPDAINRRFVTMLFEVFEHSINMYYASVLSELSDFPKSARVIYGELSPHWIYFPIHLYKLDEKRSYYETIINTETKLAEDLMSRFESMLERQDAALSDLEKKSDELESLLESLIL